MDEAAHLGVPAARLVAEVNAGLQQLRDSYVSHGLTPFVCDVVVPCADRGPGSSRLSALRAGPRSVLARVEGLIERLRIPRSARSSGAPSEVGGSGESHLHGLARDRMLEGQPRGVQELALEAEQAGGPVFGVAGDRVSDRLQVDADLVGAPGVERRRSSEVLGSARSSVKWVRASRAPEPPTAIRVRIRGSRPIGASIVPVRGRRAALDQRQVFAFDRRAGERRLQRAVRLLGACDDEQAGGVAVEAVDDARALGLAAGELAAPAAARACPRDGRGRGARRGRRPCRRRSGARPRRLIWKAHGASLTARPRGHGR